MTDPRIAVLTGGCQCGAVRYALYARPEGAHICHCRMCQKAVSGPFAALAPMRLTDFSWTRGSPGTFLSSSVAARDFCAACGTPLSFRYLDSDWIEVTIGSFDRPSEVPPGKQYGAEKPPAVVRCIDRAALGHHRGEHGAEPADATRRLSASGPRHLAGLAAAQRTMSFDRYFTGDAFRAFH